MGDLFAACYFIYGLYYAGKNVEKEGDDDVTVMLIASLFMVLLWPFHVGVNKRK